MSTTKTYIANIDSKSRDWTLTVRITRIWEVKYNPTSETTDSLDMVLLDEQRSQIHALIKKDLIPRFKEVVKEGSVQNDSIIWFNSFTSLKFEPEALVDIPKHKFNFQPFKHPAERNNRKDIITKIIGQLTGVENKINKTTTFEERRTIHITNERDNKVTTTLWGEKANLIKDAVLENKDGPQYTVFTITHHRRHSIIDITKSRKLSTELHRWNEGTHQFGYSKSPHFQGKMCKQLVGGYPNKIEMIQVQQPESIWETMKKNGNTIKELQDLYTSVEENQVLDQECGWKYSSCNICKSKLDNCQYCNKCNLTP
ncbi:Replication protein A 70 kDa DNA-binding subunit A [Bienertia sinuspersici]